MKNTEVEKNNDHGILHLYIVFHGQNVHSHGQSH